MLEVTSFRILKRFYYLLSSSISHKSERSISDVHYYLYVIFFFFKLRKLLGSSVCIRSVLKVRQWYALMWVFFHLLCWTFDDSLQPRNLSLLVQGNFHEWFHLWYPPLFFPLWNSYSDYANIWLLHQLYLFNIFPLSYF